MKIKKAAYLFIVPILSLPFVYTSLTPPTTASSVSIENFSTRQNLMQSFPTMQPFPTLPPEFFERTQTKVDLSEPLRTPRSAATPTSAATVQPTSTPRATRSPINIFATPKASPTATATLTPNRTPQPTVAPTAKVTGTPRPTTAPVQQPSSNGMEDQVIQLVNQERSKVNLPSLSKNSSLTKSAADYAQNMATNNFFSHDGQDGSTFVSRNVKAGYSNYTFLAENIAAGQDSPQEVMQAWMGSDGHRKNILNPKAREIGVGVATNSLSRYKIYWVQEFGAR